MGTLANSEDPDKMPHKVAFYPKKQKQKKNMYVFNNLQGHLKHTIKCKKFAL